MASARSNCVFAFFQKYLFFSTENKTDKNASLRFYVSVFSVCLQRDKCTVNDHEHQGLLNKSVYV